MKRKGFFNRILYVWQEGNYSRKSFLLVFIGSLGLVMLTIYLCYALPKQFEVDPGGAIVAAVVFGVTISVTAITLVSLTKALIEEGKPFRTE